MPLFSYRWQQSFISPFVPSDDDVVVAFLQVRTILMLFSLPFSTWRLSPLFRICRNVCVTLTEL
jgi:hypothetical protein